MKTDLVRFSPAGVFRKLEGEGRNLRAGTSAVEGEKLPASRVGASTCGSWRPGALVAGPRLVRRLIGSAGGSDGAGALS